MSSLPPAWHQLRYHELQHKLWHTRERNVIVCAGRGSGKTELARRRIVRALRVKKEWPDPKYFFALPTYPQCRRVAREQILSLIPRDWLVKVPGEGAMEFKTVFGSWLFLVGLDEPARVEGNQYDGGVVDESSDQKPGLYARTLRPALTHREGWLWRIGVPKRFGRGAREFRSAFEKGTLGVDVFTWPSWDILPPEEIEVLRQELDEKDYAEQIGGKWEDAGGKAYHAFSRENVDDTIQYDPKRILYVGSDFNVNPMAWVIGQKTDRGFNIIDELWIRNTNTQETLDTLWERYGEMHRGGWVFTGDASSRNRHTSASSSDYAQIANDARFGARIRYDKSNPAIKDRLAAVNLLCKNAAGDRHLRIHPRCQHLIEDLRTRSLNEWGEPTPAESGVKEDSGHASDAIGYLVWAYYPVKRQMAAGDRLIVVG